jgi:sugar phosphate isomerase/epimerase
MLASLSSFRFRTADMNRRSFLHTTIAASLFAPFAHAIEPFQRNAPRMRLGLAAYSFREYMKFSAQKQETPEAERTLTMEAFIDHCAEWGVDGAELTSYYFPKDVTDEQLLAIRRHAHIRGVSISGTSVGNTFTHPPGADRDKQVADVKAWIDKAAILGAPHIRVFAGSVQKGGTQEQAIKDCIAQLEECAEYAGKRGIFLGIENHHGIVAEAANLIEIVKAVKSPWVGINFDSGNFQTDDPYGDLAKIAPYTVNAQIKTEMKPRGAKDRSPADLEKVVGILKAANYQGFVTLEFEEKGVNPFTAVPVVLGKLRSLIGGSAPALNAAAKEEWHSLFDGKALGLWKETDFAGKADVVVKDGQLILPQGGEITGVNLEKAPATMNYEVAFDAMRVSGDDFFVGLTFPIAENHVTFVAGGWGGTVTGISCVGGENASENETTQFKNYKNGQWYSVRVKVTPARLVITIDNEKMVDLELEGKTLGMRAGEIEISKPFGLATWRTTGAYKNIRWRKL